MWTIKKLVKHLQDDPADDVQAEPTSRRNRQPCKNTYTQIGLAKTLNHDTIHCVKMNFYQTVHESFWTI